MRYPTRGRVTSEQAVETAVLRRATRALAANLPSDAITIVPSTSLYSYMCACLCVGVAITEAAEYWLFVASAARTYRATAN